MRTRATSWWLAALQKRRARMEAERLDLSRPPQFASREEQTAAIAFFNAAYRAEEVGLRQAHALADDVAGWDSQLAECLRLYGDEEGWHRQLLTEFLAWLGGGVRPMGRTTRALVGLASHARRMESIVLVNLMFETIGSTTYRIALREVTHDPSGGSALSPLRGSSVRSHPVVRQMLTILTRDESFHVPLNVHFLREAMARSPGRATRLRLKALYHATFLGLVASTAPSRRRAERFDRIARPRLARAYAEQLARLFLEESDLGLAPSALLMRAFKLNRAELLRQPSAVTIEAAERSAERENVVFDG